MWEGGVGPLLPSLGTYMAQEWSKIWLFLGQNQAFMAGPGSKGVHITWKVSGVLVQIHGKTCLRTIHHLLMHPFGADGSKIWLFLCGLCYRRLLISQPYWCEAIRQKIAENGHFMAIFEPSGDGYGQKNSQHEYLLTPMKWAAWEHFWISRSIICRQPTP